MSIRAQTALDSLAAVPTTVSALDAQLVRIAALVPDLLHGCDGPVDAFVILSRGADMVAAGKAPSDVANAMHDALQALGISLISQSDHALGVIGYVRDSQEY